MDSYDLSRYIRTLRREIIDLKIQNDLLLKTTNYFDLSVFQHSMLPFKNTIIPLGTILEDHIQPNTDYLAITMTFDPHKFKTIQLIPNNYQEEYYLKILSDLICNGELSEVYGCFEKHKNGVSHCHLITTGYNTTDKIRKLESIIRPYLSNNERNKHAVVVKPVNEIDNWCLYINKGLDLSNYFHYAFDKTDLLL